MDDIYCWKAYSEEEKNNYMSLIESVTELNIRKILTEKKSDWDNYCLGLAKNLTTELKQNIAIYEDKGTNTNNFIKLENGSFYFKPQITKDSPDILLIPRTHYIGRYNVPTNVIVLAILSKECTFDDECKKKFNNDLERLIAHELSHYLSATMDHGAGRSYRAKHVQNQRV